MSNKIHPTAIISEHVEMGSNNDIGPNVIIEDNVKLGSNNKLHAGAFISQGTTLGNDNEVHMHAIVGHTPQDLAYKPDTSYTVIGNRNQIREFATIHRGTKPDSATTIGDDNFIMAYCHIAHNCILGNKIIMVNQASLTGYCTVEDGAFLSGMTGFHQFSRIGRMAMISALSAVNKDIPPFMICGGRPGVVLGINVVALRRAGIPANTREEIKQAYRYLYRSGLNISQALEVIEKELKSEEVAHLVSFIKESKRGICDAASGQDTIKPRKSTSSETPAIL